MAPKPAHPGIPEEPHSLLPARVARCCANNSRSRAGRLAFAPRALCGASLRGAQQADKKGRQCKNEQARYFLDIHHQRINRSREVVCESQYGDRRREQDGPESTKQGTENDGTKKERGGSAHQIALQQPPFQPMSGFATASTLEIRECFPASQPLKPPTVM